MKKLSALALTAALAAMLLAGCGGSGDTADAGSAGDGTDVGDVELADVAAIADAILAVNDVPNPRDFEDFDVEYEFNLNPDDVIQYAGCETKNTPSDSALVFVAQVKEGTVDAAVAGLEEAKESMAHGTYDAFADALAKAADARIVSSGDVVVFVIASVNGPDYSAIDEAINTALGQ